MNAAVRELGLALTAVMFLTRLPVPAIGAHSDQRLRRSARYFSLVGAGVGALAAVAVLLLGRVLPPPLCVVLSMSLTLLVTGAFHEDGFADVCDAFGGGRDREDILRIMEDSRIGAFGAIGIAMMLGTKFLALCALPFALLPAMLIAGHALSRAFAVLVMALGTYARKEGGKTRPVAAGVPWTDALVALALGAPPLYWLPAPAALAVPAALLACALLYGYFRARLGGYTGDCLGAIQQVCEAVFYLSAVALFA